ncbi:MAG: DUF4443 domain-containing protein [Candidatus Micrarchaeia archaeon]
MRKEGFFCGLRAVENKYGPRRKFLIYDVYRAIYKLHKRSMGRKKLAWELGVGEGSVRTILNLLLKNSLILIDKRGVRLTKKGKRVLSRMKRFVRGINTIRGNELTFNKNAVVGVICKDIGQTFVARDTAVRCGAYGATFIKIGKEPFLSDIDDETNRRYLKTVENLLSKIEVQEGDTVALVYADDLKDAERALWALAV